MITADSESELDVARGVAEGRLPSPTSHCGNSYFAMRLSGTGVAYRAARDEFCYRPPEIWLSDEMQRRAIGLPVVISHPESGQLDGDELAKRAIGTVVHSYVKGDELWGVARVIDEEAVRGIERYDLDTSPGVVFQNSDNITIDIGGGDHMLIEDSPSLVDHIAICERGVWSKGGPADGIEVTGGTA
jgi:hypothetical protein